MLSLESAYYNEKVAMWEPFIEPVEATDIDTHVPWQAAVEVCFLLHEKQDAQQMLR